MRAVITISIVMLAGFSCVKKDLKVSNKKVYSLSAKKSLEYYNNSNSIFLDVRTEQEHETNHISGSILIPLEQIDSRANELMRYEGKDIIVYCRSGRRSERASTILRGYGFDVMNMEGGILQWKGPITSE